MLYENIISLMFYKIKIRIKKFLASINYFIIFKNRYKNLEERINIIHKNPFTYKEIERICIFACYEKILSESVKEYIKFINSSKYKLIFINNLEISSSEKIFLKSHTLISIERENIGRDIGAYKDGFLYLKKEELLKHIKFLCFANNSVQFIPGSYANSLKKEIDIFERSKDLGMFTHRSLERYHHYQSFFYIIKRDVFLNKKYIKYWENLKLVNDKLYMIEKGEIDLSKKFYNKIKNYRLLYSSNNLLNEIEKIINEGKKSKFFYYDIRNLLPNFNKFKYQRFKNNSLKKIYKDDFYLSKKYNYKLKYLKSFIDNSNSTHSAAILYPFFLKCPFFKKDLFRNNFYSISKAIAFYENCLEVSLKSKEYFLKNLLINEYKIELKKKR
ncbi:MAG: hypothetical protein CBC84_001680 [Pelagibacteraceae bacterium TMED124]|nr:MAG: hypothetical protein CBC84_001680 [Pelagibacteraceae bacterium TMED124]